MANTYTITIKNRSQRSQSFLLFQDIPEPATFQLGQVFDNVYQRAAKIVDDAQVTFQISSDVYAIHGTSNKSQDGVVEVKTSDYMEVKLGPNGSRCYLTTENSYGRVSKFEKEDYSTQAEGAFIISSDKTFHYSKPTNMYFGVGAKIPSTGEIIPVQTYKTIPDVIAQVYPRARYYVAFGDYQPGSIVERRALGYVLSIDFSGCEEHNATFILDDEHDYIADPVMYKSNIVWSVAPF
ncbi:uncharacterized protein FIESC28_00752 [Fusarium coffeatum]|uniref:Uncharacterized protein n=1 Tax=Fusarium coffeatum TaxID=231269 RepID=A0A366SC18_9HYPO|nr:uncharacterized protein FIESC28_00752 [Fusarium coffeatum]RBR26458.1 hypothetical protein FIESC28_00752 [Fusarium coffeatum]